jgi:cytochrome oxidase Cu insertion factor (SCO1/SenC/PrrC family)
MMRKAAVVTLSLGLALAAMAGPATAPVLAQGKPEAKKEGAPEPKVKVGSMAPDFTLKDQSGKDVALHDFKGKKNVVLAFYVFAFTGG